MNRWSEANFLERLMSPSPQRNIDKKNPCPDSELLTAFSENRVDGFVLGAVAAHLIQCPDCAELHHRLLNLAKADLQADPPEWQNAEKRLGNWMNAYLQARPGRAEFEPQAEKAASTADGASVENFRPWRIRWPLGAVAALALVAITFFFLHRTLPSRSEANIAMQPSPSSAAPALPAASQEPPQPAPETSSTLEPAPPEEGTAPRDHNSAPKPKSHATPTHIAASNQNAARREEPLEPTPSASNSPTASLETPAAETTENDTTALAEPPATQAVQSSAGGNSSSDSIRSDAIQTSKTSMNAGKGFVPVAKSAPRSAVDLPVLISLEYSTSMWIQLSSDTPTADGTFPFRGTLLKPVELPAGVPFDTETRVDGLGSVNDGRISLSIRGFFFRGTRYKLKTGSGAARVEPFNGGKTLEIWIDEDSAYERVPRGATATR
jgi:hypothetical protein